MKTTIKILALICGLGLSVAVSHADTLTIVTGTNSWRSIGPVGNLQATPIDSVGLAWESTNTGWNTSLAYDDSDAAAWHLPVGRPPWEPGYGDWPADAPDIWASGPEFFGDTPCYLRKTFLVGGTPASGLLDFRADDDAQIWINGQRVANDNDRIAHSILGIDISPYLRSGTNLLAVKAHNSNPFAPLGQNHESFALRLVVMFTPASLSIRLSQVELCWQSATNVSYQLQYQSALTGGQWTDLGAPIVGDGSRKCVTDAIAEGEPRRFYRTVIAP